MRRLITRRFKHSNLVPSASPFPLLPTPFASSPLILIITVISSNVIPHFITLCRHILSPSIIITSSTILYSGLLGSRCFLPGFFLALFNFFYLTYMCFTPYSIDEFCLFSLVLQLLPFTSPHLVVVDMLLLFYVRLGAASRSRDEIPRRLRSLSLKWNMDTRLA